MSTFASSSVRSAARGQDARHGGQAARVVGREPVGEEGVDPGVGRRLPAALDVHRPLDRPDRRQPELLDARPRTARAASAWSPGHGGRPRVEQTSERNRRGSASTAARETRPPNECPTQVHRPAATRLGHRDHVVGERLEVVRRRVVGARATRTGRAGRAPPTGCPAAASGASTAMKSSLEPVNPARAATGAAGRRGRPADERGEARHAGCQTGRPHARGQVEEGRRAHPAQNTGGVTARRTPGHNGAVTRTIAVANQKGGVAKTTTVASLGAALAEQGRRCSSSTSTRSPA